MHRSLLLQRGTGSNTVSGFFDMATAPTSGNLCASRELTRDACVLPMAHACTPAAVLELVCSCAEPCFLVHRRGYPQEGGARMIESDRVTRLLACVVDSSRVNPKTTPGKEARRRNRCQACGVCQAGCAATCRLRLTPTARLSLTTPLATNQPDRIGNVCLARRGK